MFKRLSEKFLLISMYTGALGLLCLLPASAQYDPSPLTGYESIDPDNQILDFLVQGEYIGVSGNDTRIGVQVIAQGDSIFDAHFFEGGVPGDGVTDSDDHTSVPGQAAVSTESAVPT